MTRWISPACSCGSRGQQEDNRQQIRRLLVNLPLAVEEELTPRQRQMLTLYYDQGMNTSSDRRTAGAQPLHGVPHPSPGTGSGSTAMCATDCKSFCIPPCAFLPVPV